jgi:GWxTD domain-containing protein
MCIKKYFVFMKGTICLVLCLSFLHCSTKGPQPIDLDPNSQKFLDLIAYIILPIEEKIFREMPPEDRGEFLQNFWGRRDPDPSTPVNEFRQTYYQRIAMADKSFREGKPGWKTDRGRTLVLLGPPTNVLTKTMGDVPYETDRFATANPLETGTLTERPTEIWVYDNYLEHFAGPLRLVFVDYNATGEFKLTTMEKITAFSMTSSTWDNPNLSKYQWVGEIEMDEKSRMEFGIFDYDAAVEILKGEFPSARVSFDIPYRRIHLIKEASQYSCNLLISLDIRDGTKELLTRQEEPISLNLFEDQLKNLMINDIQLHKEWVLDLPPDAKHIYIEVKNLDIGKRLRKLFIVESKD